MRYSSDYVKIGKIAVDREYATRYRRDPTNAPKIAARWKVKEAVRAGILTPGPCQTCGATVTEAHHPDYSKPLEVQWLCRSCHSKVHLKRPEDRRPKKLRPRKRPIFPQGYGPWPVEIRYCRKNHPLFPENIYTRPNGCSCCRLCRRAEKLLYAARKRDRLKEAA